LVFESGAADPRYAARFIILLFALFEATSRRRRMGGSGGWVAPSTQRLFGPAKEELALITPILVNRLGIGFLLPPELRT